MYESQELKKQHSAELQQAQREQAPLQADCMVLHESKRKDFLPPSKQRASLCLLRCWNIDKSDQKLLNFGYSLY